MFLQNYQCILIQLCHYFLCYLIIFLGDSCFLMYLSKALQLPTKPIFLLISAHYSKPSDLQYYFYDLSSHSYDIKQFSFCHSRLFQLHISHYFPFLCNKHLPTQPHSKRFTTLSMSIIYLSMRQASSLGPVYLNFQTKLPLFIFEGFLPFI